MKPPGASAERLLDGLRCWRNGCDCLKARPGKGHVHCPSHEDPKPSFSVSEKDGKTLFRCQAGCTQGVVLAALQEMGLWTKPETTAKRSSIRETRYQVRGIDGQVGAGHVRKDGLRGRRIVWGRRARADG